MLPLLLHSNSVRRLTSSFFEFVLRKMYACVFTLALDPILTPSSPRNPSDPPASRLPCDTALLRQQPYVKDVFIKVFPPRFSFLCPELSPFASRLLTLLFFQSLHSFFFSFHIVSADLPPLLPLSPLIAWSCTLAIHLPPL